MKPYAGLYLRTPKRTLFWGWGKPSSAHAERPWANLADWLRAAHSLAGSSGSMEPAQKLDIKIETLSPAEQEPAVAKPSKKRRLNFVCNPPVCGPCGPVGSQPQTGMFCSPTHR
ncbi:MAG TPA: hypothetical protein VFB79_13935 [Candidatus Angelobacter sp.]|nr:hypothetical protein [Candidatus Angelobacter sp.]